MNAKWVLIVVMGLLGLLPAQAEPGISLGELRVKFDEAVEGENLDYDQRIEKLTNGYCAALERLKTTLGKEGKLDKATQVLTELEALQGDGAVEELPESADFRFRSLRNKWERSRKEMEGAHKDRIVSFAGIYLKELEARKKLLTRAGKIRQALVVGQEIERVNSVPEFRKESPEEDDPKESGAEITPDQLTKLLTGTKWTYRRSGADARDVELELRFVSKTEAVFGDNYKVQWEALKGRKVRMTRPDFKMPAEFQFDEKLGKFSGTTSDGGDATGKRIGRPKDVSEE